MSEECFPCHPEPQEFYDKDLNRIYLYSYSVCGPEGIEYMFDFCSNRKISDDEFSAALKEYEQFEKNFWKTITETAKKARESVKDTDQSSKEYQEQVIKAQAEASNNIKKFPELSDFLIEKLRVKSLVFEEQF